jgi:hypothetical protein
MTPRRTLIAHLTSRIYARDAADRSPCLVAFRRDRALPFGVFGPVERFHGFTRAAEARRDASPVDVSW